MGIRYIKSRIKRFFQKDWGLSRLSGDEFKIGGFPAVVFAVRRHFKKRKGEWRGGYPAVNDYEKNLVTIAILTKNRLDLIQPCLESIEKNLSQKYKVEVLVGDTGSREWKIWRFYRQARKKWKNLKIVKFRYYFFSKNYNKLITRASGQYIILLNNDTIVKNNWIDELVDPLRDKKIGAVGGKLLYKDDTIQHAGMEVNERGNFFHLYAKKPKDIHEANFKAYLPGVTFACVALRHDVFDRFKLDEDFREECQDTDFCLRIAEAGFGILYNPKAEIYHFECSYGDWRHGA